MLLHTLEIRDFRCFANHSTIPLHRLTVFVGENDAGKTVLLTALELLLTAKRPGQDDYHQFNTGPECVKPCETDLVGIHGASDSFDVARSTPSAA